MSVISMLRQIGRYRGGVGPVWGLGSLPPCHHASRLSNCVYRSRPVFESTRRFSYVSILYQQQHEVPKNEQRAVPGNHAEQALPKAPEGKLSIIFTDIVKSTALWEEDAKAMTMAMQKHDDILRSLANAHGGYEVKQNGDGFMIAFPTAVSALKFCLNVQQELLDQRWSDSILQHKPAKVKKDDDGTVLFRGLRLRMSAHSGEPVCVWNDVISRMDYLGPMVNRAARFIQVAEGGQIVVSEEFLLEIQGNMKSDAQNDLQATNNEQSSLSMTRIGCRELQMKLIDQEFEIRLLGEHQFKGLTEPQKLYFIVPESLRGRLELFPRNIYVAGSKGNILPEVS